MSDLCQTPPRLGAVFKVHPRPAHRSRPLAPSATRLDADTLIGASCVAILVAVLLLLCW